MKKRLSILLAVSGCAMAQPYHYSANDLGDDQHEIILSGHPGIDAAQLKGFFQARGQELCADKVYLLRRMREDAFPAENRYVLRGEIDCVGLDYFG